MQFKDKLRNFFDISPFNKMEVSKLLGCRASQISRVLSGEVPIPKRCWAQLIDLSGGYFTLADFFNNALPHHAVIIEEGEDPWTCVINLKKPAT